MVRVPVYPGDPGTCLAIGQRRLRFAFKTLQVHIVSIKYFQAFIFYYYTVELIRNILECVFVLFHM